MPIRAIPRPRNDRIRSTPVSAAVSGEIALPERFADPWQIGALCFGDFGKADDDHRRQVWPELSCFAAGSLRARSHRVSSLVFYVGAKRQPIRATFLTRTRSDHIERFSGVDQKRNCALWPRLKQSLFKCSSGSTLRMLAEISCRAGELM